MISGLVACLGIGGRDRATVVMLDRIRYFGGFCFYHLFGNMLSSFVLIYIFTSSIVQVLC